MDNSFQYRTICLKYLHYLEENKSVYLFQQKCPDSLIKMSGILDPRILPFRRSALETHGKGLPHRYIGGRGRSFCKSAIHLVLHFFGLASVLKRRLWSGLKTQKIQTGVMNMECIQLVISRILAVIEQIHEVQLYMRWSTIQALK